MRELTSIFDFFVLATGVSRRQLHAMSEEIDHALEDRWRPPPGIEGYEESRWILLDYGDVVVHLFEPETRTYYALEELWAEPSTCRVPSRARGLSQFSSQRKWDCPFDVPSTLGIWEDV